MNVVRVIRADSFPVATRLRLLSLSARLATGGARRHRRFSRDVVVRVDDGKLWLAGDSMAIDFATLVEVFLDEIFSASYTDTVVIDGGGHRGYFGAYALQRGAHAVYSYEPHSGNFFSLQQAAQSFERDDRRWHVERAALGVQAGWADLHVSSESWSHSLREPASGDVLGNERVRVLDFADVLHDVRSREPGRRLIIKLNIERMAGALIVAVPAEAWRSVSDVLLDYEPGTPEPLDEVLSRLEDAGFALVHSDGRNYHLARSIPT